MTKEEKNHQAYDDVCNCLNPSMPEDEEYMQYFNFWRPLQKYPEDLFDDLADDYII